MDLKVKTRCLQCISELQKGIKLLQSGKDIEIREYINADCQPDEHIFVLEAKTNEPEV